MEYIVYSKELDKYVGQDNRLVGSLDDALRYKKMGDAMRMAVAAMGSGKTFRVHSITAEDENIR